MSKNEYFHSFTRNPLIAFESEQFRSAFRNANLVMGLDLSRDKFTLFYGRERLQFMMSLRKRQIVVLYVIEYDQRAHEQDYLVAACQDLLGHCDYKSA